MARQPVESTPGTSSTERAYQRLKRLIITCELAPGAELREAALSERLGFGRTPVREGLRRLVHDGLVEVRARQGYRVTSISLADVQQVFELRLILEPAAVELAIQRSTPEQLGELHALAHATARGDDPDRDEGFFADHLAFHVAIARQSGNPRLARALGDLLTEMERMFHLSLAQRQERAVGHEHHELYDALVSGDVSRARAAVVEQIEQSRRRVIEALVAQLSDVSGGSPTGLALH
jgi:DNA-binding GntR family transcriptional regulator